MENFFYISDKVILLQIDDVPKNILIKSELEYDYELRLKAFCLLVFDTTNKETFDNLEQYIQILNCSIINENRLIYLVGNKCDLKNER